MSAVAEQIQSTGAENTPSPMRAVLGARNFRLFWLGEAISWLGDQFYMIALPWLVLQITGDAFAMGVVLALEGIPRALFILLGGAITDRISPRATLVVSNTVRLVLVSLMAALVLTGWVQLWMIYVFALIFGLMDAISFPAGSAIVPQLVEKAHLQIANTMVQGTAQLAQFAGPVLAGVLITLMGGQTVVNGETVPSLTGIGLALAVDALTFIFPAISIWLIRVRRVESSERAGNMLDSIREGLMSVWHDVTLRTYFFIIAAINLLVVGPLSVGIPVLADERFPEGAAAYGIMLSVYGGGSLIGTVLAGVLPKPPSRHMGTILLTIISTLGIGLVLVAYVQTLTLAALIMLGMGIANGYVVILFITWFQSRTPEAMMGRMMSLLTFASIGLIPVSNALAGAFITLDLTAFFVISGALMTGITLLSALNPATRALEPAS